MQRTAGADFALGWGLDEEDKKAGRDKVFDPPWFTLADLSVSRAPMETLVAGMTGEELLEVQKRWGETGEVFAQPAIEPDKIEPQRLYRVVLPPSLSWRLQGRQRNLLNPEAGPDCRTEDVRHGIFGQ